MNLDEKISFILRFAQMDLTALRRSSALEHLRAQFHEFFMRKGEDLTSTVKALGFLAIADESPKPEEFTQDQFESLQKETMRLMNGGGGEVPVTTQVSTVALPGFGGIPTIMLMKGPTRALFLLSCSLVLTRPEIAARLRRCPARHARQPGRKCDKMFLRIRKQQFCSKTCANRVSKQKERGRT